MPERFLRAESLRQYVRQEIEEFRSGTLNRLSSYAELSRMFGYASPKSARQNLLRSGFIDERAQIATGDTGDLKLARERILKERWENLQPSPEFAWVLGVLSAGGLFSCNSIQIRSKDKALLQTFSSRASRIFEMAPRETNLNTGNENTTERVAAVAFNAPNLAEGIGDLSRNNWPSTLLGRYPWVIGSQDYLWKFIEGFYDRRGGVFKRARHESEEIGVKSGRIYINIKTSTSAYFFLELLQLAGINYPRIHKSGDASTGIVGVIIGNAKDTRVFAQNVHSVGIKDRKLDYFRNSEIKRKNNKVYSDNEVVEEWVRLTVFLGRTPYPRLIDEMHSRGETKFSAKIYRRFGNGKFSAAREYLSQLALQMAGETEIEAR